MIQIFSNTVNIVITAAILILWAAIATRFIKNKTAKTKEAPATVINKQCFEKQNPRSVPSELRKEYIITFLCENKKLHFSVSEFSYNGYKINQQGIIKYKGSRLLDFK